MCRRKSWWKSFTEAFIERCRLVVVFDGRRRTRTIHETTADDVAGWSLTGPIVNVIRRYRKTFQIPLFCFVFGFVCVQNRKQKISYKRNEFFAVYYFTPSYESDIVGEPWKCRSISIVLSSDQVGGALRGNFKWVPMPPWWCPYLLSRVKSCGFPMRKRNRQSFHV